MVWKFIFGIARNFQQLYRCSNKTSRASYVCLRAVRSGSLVITISMFGEKQNEFRSYDTSIGIQCEEVWSRVPKIGSGAASFTTQRVLMELSRSSQSGLRKNENG